MDLYPGPYFEAIGVTFQCLKSRTFPSNVKITNGLVLELHRYINKENLSGAELVKILCKLDDKYSKIAHPNSVVNKIKRVVEQKNKLKHRKKVKGFKNVHELLDQTFQPPIPINVPNSRCFESATPNNETSSPTLSAKDLPNEEKTVQNDIPIPVAKQNTQLGPTNSIGIQTEESEFDTSGSPVKQFNLLKYKHSVLRKRNDVLTAKLNAKRVLLEKVDCNVGHYSVRNINKRDETARKNLHLLRDEQRKNVKLDKNLNKKDNDIKVYKNQLKEMKTQIDNFEKEISVLNNRVEITAEQLKVEKDKKLMSQKAVSYLRLEIAQLREQCQSVCSIEHDACNAEIVKLKLDCEEKQNEISSMQQELAEKADIPEKINIETRKSDGSFTNNVRLCIMELAGLEVAVEKVSPVLKCVSKHLFEKDFTKESLPSASTVQSIVDEGHFLTKTFIAEKLVASENWGLGRDGTTRRKQKILDTSVTLKTGDVMSLGFTRVANETAQTIQDVTKEQISELGQLCRHLTEQEFVADSLSKLSFTMSDRASNEKLADKILDEWRNELLENSDCEKLTVHHFHCMAHVLLGFHNYISPELKLLESNLVESNGPIGRDALPVFKCWSKRETFVDRAVRTTSDVFAPAGEHHGVRDKWEAYCSVNGIKSEIGNYRDNRFNALFQTSAEVFLHRKDFLNVLDSVEKPNLKLQAVKSDLKSLETCSLLQCLGLFYMKVTGPYWNLVTSGKVQYFELYRHVHDIHSFLEECVKSPEILLQSDRHWAKSDPLEISMFEHHKRLAECLFKLHEETRDLLFKAIPVVASAMLKTVNKQLIDFLPGGKYCDSATEDDIQRTNFAPVTNLSCEHHFGDLDSSQRRRPHASFHHHSSVQLLKRNRNSLMKWVDELEDTDKDTLLMSARKGGREMRKTHIQSEKKVLTEIHEKMTTENLKRKNKSNKQSGTKKRKTKENDNETETKIAVTLVLGECIAVAYQDNWYPGYVENVLDTSSAIVKFMGHCRKPGHFQWPVREDKQVVNLQFVLAQNIVPDCVNSGRQWLIKEHEHLNKLYGQFSSDFFA